MQPTGGQSIALRKRSFMPVQQLQKGEKLYLEMQVAHAGAQLSGAVGAVAEDEARHILAPPRPSAGARSPCAKVRRTTVDTAC